jgi:Patched family
MCFGSNLVANSSLLQPPSKGVPLTSVTQVLPFIMFGIGLDDSFIIFGEFVRTDHNKDHVMRVHDTFQEIGLTTFLTTLTTTVAFGLGALTSLPQLYWLALYAFPCSLVTWMYNVSFFVAVLVLDERRLARRMANPHKGRLFSRWATKKEESQTPSFDEPAKLEHNYETSRLDHGTDTKPCAGHPIQLHQTTDVDVSSENCAYSDIGNDTIQPLALEEHLDSSGKATLEDQNHHGQYHHHRVHSPASVMDRFMTWYSEKLLSKPVKILVMITFLIVTILLAWSASLFRQEFNIYEVLTDDSYVAAYFRGLEKYAERGFVVPRAYFRNVDQSDPDVQDQMENFVDQLVTIDSITSQPPFFWVKHFKEFLTYDERLLELTFNTQLDIFLSVDIFRLLYGDDIVRDPESGDIIASRVVMYMDKLDMSSLSNQIQAWRDQLTVTQSEPINSKMVLADGDGFNFFLHEETMIYVWEFYAQFVNELIFATVLALISVSLIAFVFLPHWTAVCFLSPLMAVLSIDMIGTKTNTNTNRDAANPCFWFLKLTCPSAA